MSITMGEAENSPNWEPESELNFRLAQLLLLLEQADELGRRVPSIDRLGYYDFFSANPFIVTSEDYPRRDSDRILLKKAGFLEGQLSYGQAGQRYISRRSRLRDDISTLIAWGLISYDSDGFGLTDSGKDLVARLSTIYADQYRTAAYIVLRRLVPLSNARLISSAQRWIGETWLLIDYLGDVDEEASTTRQSGDNGDR